MIIDIQDDKLNKRVGVIMSEDQNSAEKIFDTFLNDLSPSSSKENSVQAVSQLMTRDTEHSVYYASSMNPSFTMRSIVAYYNTASLTSLDISKQRRKVSIALGNRGLYETCGVSDSASSNQF